MSKCIIYFFKEFRTNQYGLIIENDSEVFSALLPFDDSSKVMGGILYKNDIERLRDFLNVLLTKDFK
jgi:hypothetical protein